METFYRSIPEFIVKTDDITKLSNRACDNLKLGDEVILLDGDEQIKYNITSKSADGMKLANITGEAVVEVIYSKEGNAWSYVETKSTELGGGTSLKVGHYILNGDTNKYEWVEEVPEAYSDTTLEFADDGYVYVNKYLNGELSSYVGIDGSSIEVNDGGVAVYITENGIDKINFPSLTHSFDELDATLKQIVEDAIANSPQSCTLAQWYTIKALLDKSLYIKYQGTSMIKVLSDGISAYAFGGIYGIDGFTMDISFSATENELSIEYNKI